MSDEPCMCGTDFTCMADEHDRAIVRIQQADEAAEDVAHDAVRAAWGGMIASSGPMDDPRQLSSTTGTAKSAGHSDGGDW